MSWNPVLNFPAHCVDIADQIVGPNAHKEYFIVKSAQRVGASELVNGVGDVISSNGGYVEATLELMDKHSLSQYAMDTFRVTRAKQALENTGRNVQNDILPVAFRRTDQAMYEVRA